VTDSDDLWIGMAQFDTGLADGLWEGLPPPGDAPEWYGKVSTLIHAASAPAAPSDLAGESSIVARMQAALVDAADPPRAIDLRHAVVRRRAVDSPRHLAARRRAAQHEQGHGARLVGRIVAVKAVALTTAVVLGVTAAAATTGIVATVVVPALQHRNQPSVEKQPAIVVDPGGGSPSGSESPGGPSGSWRPDCVLLLETCGRDGDGLGGEDPDPDATGDDPADATTASDAPESDATGEAVGDAGTAATVPPAVAPSETTTTTTQPPPTTTTTSEPPPTTTPTEPPAPLIDESADDDGEPPPLAAIVT
jgi:hypothetical protein